MEAAVSYSVFATAAGYCAIAWTDVGVVRCQLPLTEADATLTNLLRRFDSAQSHTPTAELALVIADVQRYFEGERVDFSAVRVDLRTHNPFFIRIYEALRRIPWGQTTTYGSLAQAIGANREHARAVGAAMAKNPLPLIIPCHRVLAAGGKMGGFSAAGGVSTKQKMLELEHVHLGLLESPQQTLPW